MISVSCRVRPELNTDKGQECVELNYRENTVTLKQKYPYTFKFDKVYDSQASQEDVFKQCVPVLENVISGINGTIFAYGATCCGKTYTLAGPDYVGASRGIVSRAVEWVFRELSQKQSHTNHYRVSVSFLEIYLERVRDLLNPSSANLYLCDGEAVVPDAYEIQVSSVSEVIGIIYKANLLKVMAPNKINYQSSRSHCVIQLFVRQTTPQGERKSSLFLADLAGSEKVNKTEAQGLRLDEAKNINKSLLALGKVVNALVTRLPRAHIPYRDSKLTRILQGALGGNCKTLIIVHLAPTDDYISESLYTLLFAQRAKFVRNEAQQNQFIRQTSTDSPYAASGELLRMRALVKRLWFGEKVDKQEVDAYIKRISNEQFLRNAWTNADFDEGEMRHIYEIQYNYMPLLSVVQSQHVADAAEPYKTNALAEPPTTAPEASPPPETLSLTTPYQNSSAQILKYRRESALLHAIIDDVDLNLDIVPGDDAILQIRSGDDAVVFGDAKWVDYQHYAYDYYDDACRYLLTLAIYQGRHAFALEMLDRLQDCSLADSTGMLPMQILLDSTYVYIAIYQEYFGLFKRIAAASAETMQDPDYYLRVARYTLPATFLRQVMQLLLQCGVPLYTDSKSVFPYLVSLASEVALQIAFDIFSGESSDLCKARLGEAFFVAIRTFAPHLKTFANCRVFDYILREKVNGKTCAEYSLECVNFAAFRTVCDKCPDLLTYSVLRQIFLNGYEELMLYSLSFDLDFYEAAEIGALSNRTELFYIINDKYSINYSADFLSRALRSEVDRAITNVLRAKACSYSEALIVAVVEGGAELPKELYQCTAALEGKIRGVSLAEYLYLKAPCTRARALVKFITGQNKRQLQLFRADMQRVKMAAVTERKADWLYWCKELAVE